MTQQTTIDYSHCRMTDWKWIDEYQTRIGKEDFDKFLNQIYGWLMNLKPGQSIDLTSHDKITDRNRDLVIKIGCLFIQEGNIGYQFTNDFTQITNNSYVPGTRKTTTSKGLAKQGEAVSV